MDISFLIVTKHRAADLKVTLDKLYKIIDLSVHEVLVLIDGCNATEAIVKDYNWVNWTILQQSVSASPARAILYKKAKGDIFVGLDDDAHPLTTNFNNAVKHYFEINPNLGIIAFQEVRGLFNTDQDALQHVKTGEDYITTDFIGCGFAIKKSVYEATNGFPKWMTIYGEEPALAIEVLDLGYDILYTYNLQVNHRVNTKLRKQQGRNYYRFKHQLRNSIRYYLVYHPKPIKKLIRLLWHNFKSYALTDFKYFKMYWQVVFSALFSLRSILKFRQPVKRSTLLKQTNLKSISYS
ncbi:hypothetical protein C7H62_1950 [Mesoflavibacter sp. HG96]|uniref:Glycosyltransferase family 2 protein n=1 Tax=Mesoflavibacter profundi TaxID=2708110 RepID=A0ABT4RX84_9FLAO|nr:MULTISPECIES: glycosyltransferase [Mesoflavibacter]MDA0176125.1 glycosyltransferase family 2 protein [Mesoflavibacter profundi]QIJ89759.1 hypothetical protein C7H62_1950 [Mesoflavibacter sp. HG96]QIJ92487.1 hypothetical protein C7H56_1950 [Mesoflavibacter sp. HG37]